MKRACAESASMFSFDNKLLAVGAAAGVLGAVGMGYYLREEQTGKVLSKAEYDLKLRDVILELHKRAIFKFGKFTLKSGLTSPIYIDLRSIVAFPKLLADVSELMFYLIKDVGFDNMCGVPYTALPIATCMSTAHDVPMLMRRKEAKKYGTKKLIEGVFKAGERCVIVEDLVTSGMSVFETVKPLRDLGLLVDDVVVLVDREQGGRTNIENGGLNLHAAITISKVLEILTEEKRLDQAMADKTSAWLKDNQVEIRSPDVQPARFLSYGERVEHAENPVGKRLLRLMESKNTNLVVSADLNKVSEVLDLADRVGPYICMIKTHVDIMEDFTPEFVTRLKAISERHDFVIFEDRKFADIGNTVLHQYTSGVYKIADWADITDAHPVPGEGIIQGLEKGAAGRERGLLLLAELSCKGSLANGSYTEQCVKMAEANPKFCAGFIGQRKLSDNPGLLVYTPGVNLASKCDALGQQYRTPQTVICNDKVDGIIVGRGIYRADDPAAAAQRYRDAAWGAYSELLAASNRR